MKMVIAHVADEKVPGAVKALQLHAAAENIQVYEAISVAVDNQLEEDARRATDAVRPMPNQHLRRELLRKLLSGRYDTFMDQQGEADHVVRTGFGAISKALKEHFHIEHAIELLATRKKTKFDDGGYRGTVYTTTALGKRVRELLEAEGAI